MGLVHRLEMPEDQVLRWSQVMGDYEVLQPFDQLGRQTYAPTQAELGETRISRGSFMARTGRVLGLENRGWRKGENEQGMIQSMVKPLGGGALAEMPIDQGIMLGMMEEAAPEQKITHLDLEDRSGPVRVGALSRAAYSELVRDVELLRE